MCFCSAQFLWFSYLCKLIYSIQLPSASLQFAVCCRRIHVNKDSLHPVGCRSTDNKNTPLHVNMQGASLLSDICSADAVFIKLYLARYHSNSQIKSRHYTLLYRNYGSIWFYMCSTVQSPQAVLNGVIILLSNICYHFLRQFLDIFSNRFYPYFEF